MPDGSTGSGVMAISDGGTAALSGGGSVDAGVEPAGAAVDSGGSTLDGAIDVDAGAEPESPPSSCFDEFSCPEIGECVGILILIK